MSPYRHTLAMILFACFAVGLPLVAMEVNVYEKRSVHRCTEGCYQDWKDETGGILEIVVAQAEARADATPQELGKQAYTGCISCHGAAGEGGIGPALAGSPAAQTTAALQQYRNGETRGDQSSLMWSQAAALGDDDIANLSAFIESL